jgi:hypothetical protein
VIGFTIQVIFNASRLPKQNGKIILSKERMLRFDEIMF